MEDPIQAINKKEDEQINLLIKILEKKKIFTAEEVKEIMQTKY